MSKDLHRYGVMIHRKGTSYEDDPDYKEWDPFPKIKHKQNIDTCIVVPAWY